MNILFTNKQSRTIKINDVLDINSDKDKYILTLKNCILTIDKSKAKTITII